MKRIIIFLLLIFVFSLPASAKESEDTYRNMYPKNEMESAEQMLPEDARKILENNSVDAEDADFHKKIDIKKIFESVAETLKKSFKKPFASTAEMAAIVIIGALIKSFALNDKNEEIFSNLFAVIVAASVLKNIFHIIKVTAQGLKGGAGFMLAIVPVFTSVAAMSGKPVASISGAALILAAAQVIVNLCASVLAPLMSAYMAVSVCGSVSPLVGGGLAETIKKTAIWIMGFISAAFTGILSLQTTLISASDGIKLKTAKFLAGSLIPAMGSAVSEAISALSGSVDLIKSSIGIYAVLGVAVVIFPVIAELVAWRISIWVLSIMSTALSDNKSAAVLKSADSVLAVLTGITAFTAAVFVISMGITVSIK